MTDLEQRFIAACKKAAELRPDKLVVVECSDEDCSFACVHDLENDDRLCLHFGKRVTQNDVEEMCKAVGRTIWVEPRMIDDAIMWIGRSALLEAENWDSVNDTLIQLKQIDGAKAAWIAIVKELEKKP